MKRYMLFAGHCHYPAGALDDLRATADTITELKQWFAQNSTLIADHQYVDNWAVIVEHKTMHGVAYGKQFKDHPAQWSSAAAFLNSEQPELVVI